MRQQPKILRARGIAVFAIGFAAAAASVLVQAYIPAVFFALGAVAGARAAMLADDAVLRARHDAEVESHRKWVLSQPPGVRTR